MIAAKATTSPHFNPNPNCLLQEEHKNAAYVALNNIEVASAYTRKLRVALEQMLDDGLAAMDKDYASLQKEQLAPLFADMNELAEQFEATVETGQTELWSSMEPTLMSALETLTKCKFAITEAEHATTQSDNVWVQTLLRAMQAQVSSLKVLTTHYSLRTIHSLSTHYSLSQLTHDSLTRHSLLTTPVQEKLTPGNADGVIQKMVLSVVHRIEMLILSKQFNQLGGLQLDKDSRSLFVHCHSLSIRSVFEAGQYASFSRQLQHCHSGTSSLV